ncbi:unnamed protein product [Ectocarpus sp. 13 AM-2016]
MPLRCSAPLGCHFRSKRMHTTPETESQALRTKNEEVSVLDIKTCSLISLHQQNGLERLILGLQYVYNAVPDRLEDCRDNFVSVDSADRPGNQTYHGAKHGGLKFWQENAIRVRSVTILGFGQGWVDRLEFLQNCLILPRGSAQKCRCGTRECARKQGTLGVPDRTNAKRVPLWLRSKRQSPRRSHLGVPSDTGIRRYPTILQL